jgi:GNAT superfamily N-acetyltransferase
LGRYVLKAKAVEDWDKRQRLEIDVFDPERDIPYRIAYGKFRIKPGFFFQKNLQASMIQVADEYQRKGIATAIYQYVKKLGNTVKPSPYQLGPGQEMWKSFKKSNTLAEKFIPEQGQNISTAYHVTTVPAAEDILLVGLHPSDGKVFLVPDLDNEAQLRKELGTVTGWMYAKTEHTDDPLTLLQVNVAGIPLEYYNGWYVAIKPIEPGRIKDLGESALAEYY